MPFQRWIESANNAIEGILHAVRTERHVQYHLATALAVLFLSYVLGISRNDFIVIAVIMVIVLLAEMFNTAIECVVDLISPERREKARIAKDIAAGAVLITAFGAVILGYIILFPYLAVVFHKGMSIAKRSPAEISLLSFVVVVILVIMLKAWFGTGHPLRGGMPSGHAALSFSAWALVTLITENLTASLATFVLAALVARSRISSGTHTLSEVFAGCLLGACVATAIYLLFI
ncbi:MAG TPA: diacylglycerol kinase [Dissulfurispiraceae bacterium]|nr:diacylglycerol kinase [Dissulfurispiraceae bacterium]